MRRYWVYFVPAGLILLTALAVRVGAGSDGPAESGSASAPTSSTSTSMPVVTTITTTIDEAPHQPEHATPVDLDLSAVDRIDPQVVAAARGCAYWAHPRGETAEGLAQRLSPVATPEMTAAVAELRMPDSGQDVVEAYPGAIERETKITFSIGCRTLTAGPDGAPTAPPTAVLSEVTVVLGPDTGWTVVGANVGGLVLH